MGNDKLYANADNNVLYGGAGNDQLFAIGEYNKLYGGTGNDVLNGRRGEYTVYYYRQGDGFDRISARKHNNLIQAADIVKLGQGIEFESSYFEKAPVGGHLLVSFAGKNGHLQVDNFFDKNNKHNSQISQFQFQENEVMLTGNNIQIGNQVSETLIVENGVNYLAGGEGSDTYQVDFFAG